MAEEHKLTGERRDYTHHIARAESEPDSGGSGRHRPAKKRRSHHILPVIIAFLLIIAGGAGAWLYTHQAGKTPQSTSPVPEKIIKSVSFPVYYPDPKRLPPGYTLDSNSFSSGQGVVDYSVSTSSGKKIVFTVQQRPSDIDIKAFYAAHMPLTVKIQTKLGAASIGAIGTSNVYSLPAKDAWLIISTSLKLDDDQIKSLLQTLTRP